MQALGKSAVAGMLKGAAVAMALSVPLSAAVAQEGAVMAEAMVITVTGEGRVDQAPDMATVSLGVTTEGATAAEALGANSAEIAKVLERLGSAGIEPRDVQTTGLSVNPNWQHYSSGEAPKISGFIANNGVTVRVRALDGLGSVLDAAVQDGANQLNGVEFGLQEPRPSQDEARRRAVADARARAELLAEAAGVKLGAIRSINETMAAPMPMPAFRMAAEAVAGAPVPVAAGEVATTANVMIVWEIAQ
jgi:uncharacterized protein YggE